MELVYLYIEIENYKNIKNQGFNFSPRFHCEYDKDKNELIIKEKEYNSIFPDNINVTAIVGKNGSGKSSILDFYALFNFSEKSVLNKYKGFMIIKYDNNFYFSYKDTFFKNIQSNIKLEFIEIKDNNTFKYNFYYLLSLHLNYGYSYHEILDFTTTYTYNTNYTTDKINYIRLPDKKYGKFDIVKYEKFLENILLINNIRNTQLIDTFFIPKKIELYLNIGKIRSYLSSILDKTEYDKIEPLINNIKSIKEIFNIIEDILNKLTTKQIDTKEDILPINFFKLNGIKEYKDNFYIQSLDTITLNPKNLMTIKDSQAIYIKEIDIKNYTEIEQLTNFLKTDTLDFFSIEIYDKNTNKTYNQLSDGEKQLLGLINIINYYAFNHSEEKEEITTILKDFKFKEYLILLDELESFLHPKWQTQIINNLINYLKKAKAKFHLIFTTHSPFLLSDIPKENIIFLENGKQVDVDIDTFGANIHTLLTHGFFMDDGLMGEFAKSKINEAIEILNKKQLSKDEIDFCENIISKIGEPILKRQLQKMVDSKRLSKIDEIDEIKKQINELQKKMEKLENDKN